MFFLNLQFAQRFLHEAPVVGVVIIAAGVVAAVVATVVAGGVVGVVVGVVVVG